MSTNDRAALPLRLSAHVLAHLRAVAEGIAPSAAARRYLLTAADDGAALRAHLAAVDAGTAVARRAGTGPRWRLLRMAHLPVPAVALPPPLEEWAEARGYDGFSHDELLPLYELEHVAPSPSRKARQAERLRRARLALLDELAAFTAQPPALADGVALWFGDDLAARLERAGFHRLGDLRVAISVGGRWWTGIQGFGPVKAAALADQIGALVGWPLAPTWRADAAARATASDDAVLIEAWIRARTRSDQTARAYRREVQRFTVWLLAERRARLASASVDDCAAYAAFLAGVPPEWMSRRNAARFGVGWAPFASQPSPSSQRYALGILSGFYAWAVGAGELPRNPWVFVNLDVPDDPKAPVTVSRAFTPAAWKALLAEAERLPRLASDRMRFLLVFAQATGLRAGELLAARRGHVMERPDGFWLRVHGKGARNRLVVLPFVAMQALRDYLGQRGLVFEDAGPEVPLLAHLTSPGEPLTYPTLSSLFRRFSARALLALPMAERDAARGASLHWLRHTHATRAIEKNVPADVVQANLGHSDPRTTATYYRAQERRRMQALDAAFGDEGE